MPTRLAPRSPLVARLRATFGPGKEQADIAGDASRVVQDPGAELESARLELRLPVLVHDAGARRQGGQPLGLLPHFRLVAAGFADRRQVRVVNGPAPIGAEAARE